MKTIIHPLDSKIEFINTKATSLQDLNSQIEVLNCRIKSLKEDLIRLAITRPEDNVAPQSKCSAVGTCMQMANKALEELDDTFFKLADLMQIQIELERHEDANVLFDSSKPEHFNKVVEIEQ